MEIFVNIPFEPTMTSLLSGIDIEYKDDSFRIKLLELNPGDKNDRETIIKNYILKDQDYLTYRHKFMLVQNLEKSLADELYDFDVLFEYDFDTDQASLSPWSAEEIKTPRSFYEDILKVAKETWKCDLDKAAVEDLLTW